MFERLVVGLFILAIHISPVAFDVAIEGFLDELGKIGVLACQVIDSSCGHNLTGIENSVDYE